MGEVPKIVLPHIAEGSAASGTSKETEIKLTNVARATLDELIEDYRDWLTAHNEAIWSTGDKRVKGVREYAIAHEDWTDWKPIFEQREGAVLANAAKTPRELAAREQAAMAQIARMVRQLREHKGWA